MDAHGFVNALPFLLLRLCGSRVDLAFVPGNLRAQFFIALPSPAIQFARLNRRPHRAAIFDGVTAIPEAAVRGESGDFRESGIQALGSGPHLQLAHPWRIDERAAIRQSQQFPISRGVTAATVTFPYLLDWLPFRAQELSFVVSQIGANIDAVASAERRGWLTRLLGPLA